MTHDNFHQVLASLNPKQRQAVELTEGPVMVIAGPGTGKTQVLAARVGQILSTTQAQPENILVLSFTDNAAWQLQQRLVSLMGSLGYRVPVMTFHSWCASLFARFPDHFEAHLDATMVSEVEQAEILEKAIEELPLELIRPVRSPMYYLSSLKASISTLKREAKTPTELKTATVAAIEEIEEAPDLYHTKGRFKGRMKSEYAKALQASKKTLELAMVYEYYETYLATHHRIDYDSIILSVVTQLANDPLLVQLLAEQYHYFLIDEHQDTNAAQNRAVILITGQDPRANVFVVGDDKQAIFRFQGGTIANFLLFPSIFSETTIVQLTDNYRSSQVILDAAATVLDTHSATVETLLAVPLKPLVAKAERSSLPLTLAGCADPVSEMAHVVSTMRHWLDQGVSSSEIAVISKTNLPLRHLASQLQAAHIPYYLADLISVFDDPAVMQLKHIMDAVAMVGSEPELAVALAQPCLELDPLELAKKMALPNLRAQGLWSLATDDSIQASPTIKAAIKLLHQLTLEKATLPPSQLLIEILKATSLYAWVARQPGKMAMIESLKVFVNRVRELEQQQPDLRVESLVKLVEKAKDYRLNWTAKQPMTKEGVRLLTAHGAKGLEFEKVIIIGLDNLTWKPDATRRELLKLPLEKLGLSVPTKDDHNADLERLLYVAMTRAKEEVVLTYSTNQLNGRELMPSVLLSRLPEGAFKPESIPSVSLESMITMTPRQTRVTQSELADYLRGSLRLNPLSVSGLNNFLACPWTYVFRNLMRLPESRTPVQSYGTAIHALISELIKTKRFADLEYARSLIPKSLAAQGMPQADIDRYTTLGRQALEAAIPQVISKLHPETKSEVRLSAILDSGFRLTGILDAIEPVGSSVRVYDFKTSSQPSRSELEGSGTGSGNYQRQLVFYSLLLQQSHPKKQMEEGVLVFLTPDKGMIKTYQKAVQPSDRSALLEQIRALEASVESASFFHTRCTQPDCDYCELASTLFASI